MQSKKIKLTFDVLSIISHHHKMHTYVFMIAVLAVSLWAYTAHADPYSATITGMKGLNTVPSARMGKAGDIRFGAGTLDPYLHGFAGVQLLDPLYIQVRQTAEVSSLSDDARRLYPGVDMKLRLAHETDLRPAIAVGLQSLTGHKRMAGEFIAASKRFKAFDFTAGLGWGRYGTAAHFDNPLGLFGSHFDKPRSLGGDMPNGPEDWFTGESVGVFGGVEYFTPIKHLSLKLDYGADRYRAEGADTGYNTPEPWAVGLKYQPVAWADLSFGMQGTDKIMARINFNGAIKNWRDQTAQLSTDQKGSHAYQHDVHSGAIDKDKITQLALDRGLRVDHIASDGGAVQAHIFLDPARPAPLQIRQAAAIVAQNSPHDIRTMRITPINHNLTGKTVSVPRSDLSGRASPQEIWNHTDFRPVKRPFLHAFKAPRSFKTAMKSLFFTLENQASLSEEDAGHLRRTSFLTGFRGMAFKRTGLTSASLRVNLEDNLDQLAQTRPPKLLPVRSNVADFADNRIAVDTFHQTLAYSPNSDWHVMARVGFVEEMYAGFGGEVLYRPFGKRFALGAETYLAMKRDPAAPLALGLNGDRLITGHINGWYDIPRYDVTLKASAGRYLAEDIGGTLALSKEFKNGATVSAFSTLTDTADVDVFGGATHAYHGVRLALPLGGFQYTPQNSALHLKAEPFARDIGQKLDMDDTLYDMTTPLSLPHMAMHWDHMRL